MSYKKIINGSLLFIGTALVFSGCSLKNPFGIGYDSSVCESSKDFGVCGSPKDIYKHRDKIRKVQQDYLRATLDTVLFFGINKRGEVVVKEDRDGKWELYELSEWREIIEKRNEELKDKINKDQMKIRNNERKISGSQFSLGNDIPVTKSNDLSIQYHDQGPLLVTRSKVGDIIRDNGLIQQVFISNYIDKGGDLISSHEVFIVVKDPQWVVGEKTPKAGRIEELPTPISTNLLKRQNRVHSYQEKVVNSYNRNETEGILNSGNDPESKRIEKQKDSTLIDSFIQEK